MEWYEAILLVATGLIAGFINTVAGGGSLLTLPMMIFMGLPPAIANGTNRIALIIQNISATAGFRSKGISTWPYSGYLSISAIAGALLGAQISVEISGQLFNRILAIVMIGVMIVTVIKPLGGADRVERMSKKHQWMGFFAFFFVGLYGGFIQAGVGFIVIATLSAINHLSLVKINSAKVFIILIYTCAAIVVFIVNDKINWYWGLILAIGNSTGGWIGSRWQVGKGERWIKRILLLTVVAMAMKLWFF